MPPQGDFIQLSPSCNGRYINPQGGSSRPCCQSLLQKLQHWTNRAVNWVYWDDSWEAKRSTSALPNRFHIWDTVWRFNIHSLGLSLSVSTENQPQGSVFQERELPSKKGTCPRTKGEDGAQACPGCATVNLPDGLCETLPPYCPFWLWYDAPREWGENTSKPGRQPWVPGSLCARKGTLLSIPRSPVYLRRPRPSPSLMRPSWSYGDGGSHPFWPRSGEKRGSRHCKRGREQLHDTLIRRVVGIVGCNLSSFIHQRNGLIWSNPRGNTGEAAAMRPSSLRQVPTETWWPSLKRARHAVKLDIWAGAKRACIWMESKRTPKNTVRWDGRSTLFLATLY